jgi:hypothetical protein
VAITKDSVKTDEPKEASPKRSSRAASKKEEPTLGPEESNFWKLSDDADVPELVLSVGGTNYEFRKASLVNLPAGQTPDHPDVHKVED